MRTLLEATRPDHYLGVDISRAFLLESTRRLAADYPWLDVHASCADYSTPLRLPEALKDAGRPVAFFPGSSIGNFEPAEALQFLINLRSMLTEGGGLLIGIDRMKSPDILEAAYNDAAGVTAAFNRNLLTRYANELGSDIDPERFTHHAFLNQARSRIEMHLVSQLNQVVMIGGRRIPFREGESIHTENSWKYTDEGFLGMAEHAGFESRALWHDRNRLFSVHYLVRSDAA